MYMKIYTKKFISRNPVIRFGDKIARKDKTGEPEDPGAPLKTGKPMLFIVGLAMLLIGLFISLGSVFHNILEVFTNETSGDVYGPYDWTAAIIGALALLVGIIILMFSKSSPKST